MYVFVCMYVVYACMFACRMIILYFLVNSPKLNVCMVCVCSKQERVHKSMYSFLHSTLSTKGPTGLFAGVGPAVIGSGFLFLT